MNLVSIHIVQEVLLLLRIEVICLLDERIELSKEWVLIKRQCHQVVVVYISIELVI